MYSFDEIRLNVILLKVPKHLSKSKMGGVFINRDVRPQTISLDS